MSFQAYLDNIKAKTGKTPDDFKKQLQKEGLLKYDLKANELVQWLKKNYDLDTDIQWQSGLYLNQKARYMIRKRKAAKNKS